MTNDDHELFGAMRKKQRLAVPSLETLVGLLDQRAARTHEALSAAGVKSAEARRLNEAKRRRAHWKKKRDGGVTYAGVDHSRKLALAGWKVLVARMVPGEWYALSDMAELIPEFAYPSAKAWAVKLRRLGLTERARNPEFDESKAAGNQSASQWLARLTGKGEALGEQWRKALG
jgi:hypothetical protein